MNLWLRKTGLFVPALAPVLGLALLGAQGDQTQTVLSAMREAAGGEGKIKAVKSLTAEGSYRRTMGEREMAGDIEWYFLFPDKFQRVEQFQGPGGMPGPRLLMTLNGETGWSDMQGGGGGMMIFRGPGGPGGGPGGPGGPGGGGRMDPSQFIRGEFHRVIAGVLPVVPGVAGLSFRHAGQAESNDGTADILDIKNGERVVGRLFVDSKSHLPLMLTYMAPQPQIRFNAPQRSADGKQPSPEEVRKRFEEERAKMAASPPPMVENTVFYAEHQKVDGIMLPHRLTRAVDGKTTEEIEIKKYEINATIDPQQFEKKGS